MLCSNTAGAGGAIEAMQERALRVLVVEDDRSQWTVYRIALEALGLEQDFAVSGEEALQKANQRQYDLVLFDLGLPTPENPEAERMSAVQWGAKICIDLRQILACPIAIVSVYARGLQGRAAVDTIKPEALLYKPVLQEDLQAAIMHLLPGINKGL